MGEPWPKGLRVPGEPPHAARPTAPPAVPPDPPRGQGANATAGASAQALQLYALLLDAQSLAAAAHALVARLAADLHCDRVSIGLGSARATSLLASSNLDAAHASADLHPLLLGAMEEALDQGLTLAWPPADIADLPQAAHPAKAVDSRPGAASDAITLEHRALQQQVGGAVATVPLGRQGHALAAVCLERHRAPAFSAAELERLEIMLQLVAPALQWMQDSARPWHARARAELSAGIHGLRQPQRRKARTAWVAAGLALLFLAAAPLPHQLGGRARIEGAEQRVLAAPTDGFVKTAHVRPGDRVKLGDALVDLMEQDLRLERERWSSQLAQHENAYAAAMARSDRVMASTSLSKVVEAQSQLALVDEQLQRGRMTAPFDALVIDGDLSQAIGAPVRQGDKLLTLATADRYRVAIEVSESDIGRIEPGQTGRLVLSSLPWDGQDLRIERIAPLARAVDGRNVFEVEAVLSEPAPGLRPGLIGRAEVTVGHLPLLWAWTRSTVDRLRLAWWGWLG
jgi:multidrug efflux pump subunit AcrA (membrane-fusion protein)